MKSIGIIKEMDSLGRIVIPKEMRDFLKIAPGDEVEIQLTTEGILVSTPKYQVVERKKKN